jgi:penicillin-binding protein 1C
MEKKIIRLDKNFVGKSIIFIFFAAILIYLVRLVFITLTIKFQTNRAEPLTVLDRNANIVYKQDQIKEGYLEYRKLEQINPYIIEGIIASEDKTFRSNIGIDFLRILKCTHSTVFQKQTCGASTITQQYLKLERNTQKRSIVNKIDEMFLSIFLNFAMKKDEILERYLNKVYFGNLRYGINSASKGYFKKENTELNLAESTFLLSIPNSPVQMDPYTNFENTKRRQKIVLDLMLKNSFINTEEYELALETPISVGNFENTIEAPHFVRYVTSTSNEKTIETTLDINLYQESLKIVREKMDILTQYNAQNTSVVILDAKTGEILTMIGSIDFFSKDIEGQVNSAIAKRNPGSTIKPFLYAYAFSKNVTAATLIEDKEQIFKTFDGKYYFPRNYDRKEHGFVSARQAIGNSFNIPAVSVLSYISQKDKLRGFYDVLNSIGLEEAEEQGSDLAAALGGFSVSLLDLTNAYRIFANEGIYLGEPIATLKDEKSFEAHEVFEQNSREIAYIISDILNDEESRRWIFGSMGTYNLPFKASVKSGTTTDFYDSWTVGYTQDFVIGVWVGNNDHSKMHGITGTAGAGKIWKDLMVLTQQYYEQNQMLEKHELVSNESNIVSIDICSTTGDIYTQECEGFSYEELFIKEKNPTNPQMVKKIAIIDSQLIEITSPSSNDTYLYAEGLRIEIQFHPNKNFDEYILLVDDKEIERSNSKKSFFTNITQSGKHSIQIKGIDSGKSIYSSPVFINVENYED